MCPAPAANGRAVCDAGACRIVCDPSFMLVGNNCERVPMNCGNRALDAGETCDDGNMVAGDGCSPMCQTEPGTITTTCGGARTVVPIALNQVIRFRGATSGMTSTYNSCPDNSNDRANGPEAVFQVRMTAAGRLRTTITPEGGWDIILKGGTTCPGQCVDRGADGVAETAMVTSPLPMGTVFNLVVDGFNNGDSGRFTLETTLVP